jgi:heme/copper-type cytochrome/quinol oxidase subunit 1
LFGRKMYNERLANWHFWLMFVGFNLTFFPQFMLGLRGMARRVYDYPEGPGYVLLNQISTVGAFMIAVSVLLFFINVLVTKLSKQELTNSDPWGGARHIEWKLWEEGRVVHGEGLILDKEPVPLKDQEVY